MSKYTTGEMAKLCNVSVRTVQFYDIKGLLLPSELTEGGRRLYNNDDLTKLRLICTLKAIGLSLDSIKGILESESPGKILSLLLDEQTKQLGDEIKEKQNQLEAVKVIKECIRDMTIIPANSIIDIEHMMKNKKGLRKVHGTMLGVGIIMDAIQIGAVALWIVKGIWIPFAIGMPLVILFGVLLTRMYYKNTAYICAECNATFQPTFRNFIFSAHTPKTRKLSCTKCGHTGYCVEVYAKDKIA
jgi:DNA-binding transcriptional MerR regulator/DNA-directed RNA polymerase subunit RPC12/RpoP